MEIQPLRSRAYEALREKCPNADQKKTPYLDIFHAVKLLRP